jgi:hypothetical protein
MDIRILWISGFYGNQIVKGKGSKIKVKENFDPVFGEKQSKTLNKLL